MFFGIVPGNFEIALENIRFTEQFIAVVLSNPYDSPAVF